MEPRESIFFFVVVPCLLMRRQMNTYLPRAVYRMLRAFGLIYVAFHQIVIQIWPLVIAVDRGAPRQNIRRHSLMDGDGSVFGGTTNPSIDSTLQPPPLRFESEQPNPQAATCKLQQHGACICNLCSCFLVKQTCCSRHIDTTSYS